MGGKIDLFNLGALGVDLDKSPIHLPDGAWRTLQNGEFSSDLSQGGVRKRGSLTKLNTVALAGSVQSVVNVPLPLNTDVFLMVGMNNGAAPTTWKQSEDGAVFTDLVTADAPIVLQDKNSLGIGYLGVDIRCASYKRLFYYPGDDYTPYPNLNDTAPPFLVYNGVLAYEMFRVPKNPVSKLNAIAITDLTSANGLIYFSTIDGGGVAPDVKGRVFAFNPSNGVLTEVGNRFGQASDENGKGAPMCLCNYQGRLWAGTYGVSGNAQGRIYAIHAGVDTAWTQDHQATLHNGYYHSLCAYRGQLFAATDADSSGTAVIEVRTAAGAWSTSLSAPASNLSRFRGMIVFDGNLYCGYTDFGNTTSLIKQYNNSAWATDLDIGATYSLKSPGIPFVFKDELYWPCYIEGNPSSTAGFLLKRTTGGVWSKVLDTVGLRGSLGQFSPDAS